MTSPLRPLAAALGGGALAGLLLPSTGTLAAAAVAAGAAAWALLGRVSRRAWLAAALGLGVTLGVLRAGAADVPAAGPDAEAEVARLHAVVTHGADARPDPLARGTDGTPPSRVASFELRARDARGRPFGAVAHIRIAPGERVPRVLPGDRIAVTGRLTPVRPPTNPGQMDRRRRLALHGITHDLRIPSPGAVRAAAHASGARWAVARWGERVRRALLDRLRSACGEREAAAALLSCLLVGDRAALGEGTREAFRRAGVSHLLAVSGLHVVLLTTVLASLARSVTPLRLRRHMALPTTILLLLAYCAVCRFATPVVRAAVFLSVRAVARRAGRRSSTLDQLGIAAALVLVAAPAQILDVGFHLSFAAVAGLVLLTPALHGLLFARLELLRRFPEALPPWRLRLYLNLARGFSATCAAQVATAPIVAQAFGELHASGLLTNLAAVPVTAVVLPAAAGLAALGDAVPALTGPIAALLHGVLTGVVNAAPTAPPSLTAPGPPGPWVLLVSLALIALAAAAPTWRRRHLLLPLAAWIVLAAHPLFGSRPDRPVAVILDVGHGSCAVLRSPSGGDLLFDAGARRPRVGPRVIVPALRALGVHRLRAVFVSHDDADHCGAVPGVLEQFRVDEVIVPAGFGGGNAAAAVRDACRRHRVPLRTASRGATWARPGLTVRTLHPTGSTGGPAGNEGSLVAHVTAEGPGRALRILFPGDVEGAPLAALAADPTLPHAEVVVLPHHGLGDARVQRRLVRRAGATTSVASASRSTPPPFPEALVTGAVGTVFLSAGGPPRTFVERSPRRR